MTAHTPLTHTPDICCHGTTHVYNPSLQAASKVIGTLVAIATLTLSLNACSNPASSDDTAAHSTAAVTQTAATPSSGSVVIASKAQVKRAGATEQPTFTLEPIAEFESPWAMAALPVDGIEAPQLLITEKSGQLWLLDTQSGRKTQIAGVPNVAYGGQGGLGDVALSPDYPQSQEIYLSYAARSEDARDEYGARVIKATLVGLDTDTPAIEDLTPIWQQRPTTRGQGHYSHRLLFSKDGRYLYISSGDRQLKSPAQDLTVTLGKIIRLYADGTIPEDNPFRRCDDAVDMAADTLRAQVWTMGHRNVLGMAFDDQGRLWAHEMGPRGGDEFNLIQPGRNYGWPIVSNGRHYSGLDIPDHDTHPEFAAPMITWTPVISPSSMSIYQSGHQDDFPAWQGAALISGLSSQSLVVVDMAADETASERYRYDMGARIRGVLASQGRVWVLEDGAPASVLRLRPDETGPS